MSAGIPLREFGRLIGVSGEAVRKAIATGKIPKEAVGEIVLKPSGRVRPAIIDPELARKSWGDTTDASLHRSKEVMQWAGRKSGAVRRGEEFTEPPPAEPEFQTAGPPMGGGKSSASSSSGSGPSINESNRIKAAYQARLAKLEYEKEIGKLVSADQIKALFSAQITEAKTKFMAVGRNARTRLPHLTIDDVEVIEALCAEALESLANGSH